MTRVIGSRTSGRTRGPRGPRSAPGSRGTGGSGRRPPGPRRVSTSRATPAAGRGHGRAMDGSGQDPVRWRPRARCPIPAGRHRPPGAVLVVAAAVKSEVSSLVHIETSCWNWSHSRRHVADPWTSTSYGSWSAGGSDVATSRHHVSQCVTSSRDGSTSPGSDRDVGWPGEGWDGDPVAGPETNEVAQTQPHQGDERHPDPQAPVRAPGTTQPVHEPHVVPTSPRGATIGRADATARELPVQRGGPKMPGHDERPTGECRQSRMRIRR